MWNSIKARIFLEAVREAAAIPDIRTDIKTLEISVNKLHQLIDQVKNIFGTDQIGVDCHSNSFSQSISYVIYDNLLFSAIFNYLKSAPTVDYIIRPQLTDIQLNTIKYAIETVYRFIGPSQWKDSCRNYIITELAKEYDLANEKFILFYDDIFSELNDTYQEESKPNKTHRQAKKIISQISEITQSLDYVLFTKVIMIVRSKMAI